MPRMLLFVTVGLIACAAGCTRYEPLYMAVERPLADGTTQTFAFKGDIPLPTHSDWAEVLAASMQIRLDEQEPQWRWMCMLKIHDQQLASVVVYDVMREVTLLLRDDSPKLTDGCWMGSTPYEPVDSAPRLTDGKWNVFVLRFDLTNTGGETRRIYQAAAFPEAFDEMVKRFRTRRGS